jgi:hypothetical protein
MFPVSGSHSSGPVHPRAVSPVYVGWNQLAPESNEK